MPKFEIKTSVKHLALGLKIAGALLLAVAAHPIAAFTTLTMGSTLSAALAARNGEHASAALDGAFIAANLAGIARAVGLLG